ncbi:hypothetical protein IWX63_002688 [Arthrobacter sp. CAN_A2]|uniref:MmcQ/YjbR family DNA-binding protein n=1 Tax=Arthrobacter sp. CAN_A2 TaxID=2787718 RepID=UPI0018EF9E82
MPDVPTPLIESDVRALCLAFHDVVEKVSWRRPAWFARTMFARMYDEGTLSIRSAESRALIGSQPDTFLVHPYGRGDHDKVLVVLSRIDRDELEELLTESYRLAGGS